MGDDVTTLPGAHVIARIQDETKRGHERSADCLPKGTVQQELETAGRLGLKVAARI